MHEENQSDTVSSRKKIHKKKISRKGINMSQYTLSGNRFMIENYDRVPAFSSFLPGLAGVKGIPLWAFYTNRGQGINSFGVHHKGNAIMEFHPANSAYERTPVKGFRSS